MHLGWLFMDDYLWTVIQTSPWAILDSISNVVQRVSQAILVTFDSCVGISNPAHNRRYVSVGTT